MIFWCKLCGAILVLSGSVGVAYSFIKETQKQIQTLETIRRMMRLLQSEVSHRNLSLTEAFAAVSDRLPGVFGNFMTGVCDEWHRRAGTTLAVIWREKTYACLSDEAMKKNELSTLAEFGEQLGFQEREMQLTMLELYERQLQEDIARMTVKARETGRIYRLLGVMGGVFAIIILI